jgi:hypothetical protein
LKREGCQDRKNLNVAEEDNRFTGKKLDFLLNMKILINYISIKSLIYMKNIIETPLRGFA